ncbi:MAG: hypothetical protein LKI93_00260 [Bifidobacteriaceae bacterium]|jgi:hypothetical protein|nr:hypothetical protein [Bifidobacteriaceae bacterium]MCI1914153.1 hypothetical protein [Bifidobacteriaceae bacterium]
MANRAQRRANQRAANKNGESGQPEGTQSATSQAMFNNKADRVAEGRDEWVPGRVDANGDTVTAAQASANEEARAEHDAKVQANVSLARKRTTKGWLKFFSWLLIGLSALAFLIVMWIPNLPMWAIVTVSAIFAVGVLSLFVVRGDNDKNPYLDENGTAV